MVYPRPQRAYEVRRCSHDVIFEPGMYSLFCLLLVLGLRMTCKNSSGFQLRGCGNWTLPELGRKPPPKLVPAKEALIEACKADPCPFGGGGGLSAVHKVDASCALAN